MRAHLKRRRGRGNLRGMNARTDIAMNPHQPLIDQLYREEILRARKQTPQERVRGAFEIAPFAQAMMYAGIRRQHPQADAAELLRLARERIAKGRRMNEWKIFCPAEAPPR